MLIKTISRLSISDFWEGEKIQEVFLKQGDLDGACGPYSLMMALILSGAINRTRAEQLWLGKVDGRTTFAKFIKDLDVLFSNGISDEKLLELFTHIQKLINTKNINNLALVNIDNKSKNGQPKNTSFLHAVKDHIDEFDRPVIVGLQWNSNDAHFAVAIGYQLKVDAYGEKLAHILTLDPGSDIGKISAWNGVLGQGEIGSKKLVYATEDGQVNKCTVDGGIGIISTTNGGRYHRKHDLK